MRIAGAALSFASGGCLFMAFATGGGDAVAVAADALPVEPVAAISVTEDSSTFPRNEDLQDEEPVDPEIPELI